MSTRSSLRAQFERRANTKASDRARSSSPVDIKIVRNDEFSKAISLVRILQENGLSLSDAHKTVTELAEHGSVTVTVRPHNTRNILDQIEHVDLKAFAILNVGHLRISVSRSFVPSEEVDLNESVFDFDLDDKYKSSTIGDLRRIYGSNFASHFKSSAKLTEVLFNLDVSSLQALAASDLSHKVSS